jgi:hydroxymethylpyrimidine pyrophosphatase-like HAD family hydrolase
MRYHVLAADYDGTLAHHGKIDAPTWDAVRRLRASGRKAIMVTGRELDDLLSILEFPELFDRIVAENGAIVYEPATHQVRMVDNATPPPPELVEDLARRGVVPLSVGRAIVATREPHQDTVLDAIHDLGLELEIIFNKGAVMVLPSSVNKSTGLRRALDELGLSPHNVVGVGDAENDHALIDACECGAAVANALSTLKRHADIVLERGHGGGVAELIDRMIDDDLASVALPRRRLLLGHTPEGPVTLNPYRSNIMICGTSGGGKSTLATGLLERLDQQSYQFAIVDPEGDFMALDLSIGLGSGRHAPDIQEVLDVLRKPNDNVSVHLLGAALEHRPEYFMRLLPALGDLRSRTGRPHWLVVDETHHLLPVGWDPAEELALWPHGMIYITVHPRLVTRAVLASLDTLIVIGEDIERSILEVCGILNLEPPAFAATGKLPTGKALVWRVGSRHTQLVASEPPKTERTRHVRKYAEGDLGKARSFYFRGPDDRLKLKAHNLQLFVLLSAGVDEETWHFHARNHDYSTWIRNEVKDRDLADEVERLEKAAQPSRTAICAAIERRYTLPVDRPSEALPVVHK